MTSISKMVIRTAAGGVPVHSSIHEGRAAAANRGDMISDHIFELLGPCPAQSLQAMIDYGLNDAEIGRYYGIPAKTIECLRNAFGITDAV